jgi:hypothetical protein
METNLKVGDVGSQQAATMPPPLMVQPWWRGSVFGAMAPPVILPENLSSSKETGESSQGDANSENENSAKEKGSSSYYLITFSNLNPGHLLLFFIISDCLKLHFLDENFK